MEKGQELLLDQKQTHYLRTVLRQQAGDEIRLFNGINGEWICSLNKITKKAAHALPQSQIRAQNNEQKTERHLFFPILKKKAALDFIIEKAVELNVTGIHPVTSSYTQVHQIKKDRILAQIIEAAEQCERLDIPELYDVASIQKKLETWRKDIPIYACIERDDTTPLKPTEQSCAFLIGPEGGFSEEEKTFIASHPNVTVVSLGKNILRAETACLTCLAISGTQE